jgi:ribosome maturation factor RimP
MNEGNEGSLVAELRGLAADAADRAGVELVDLSLRGAGQRRVLRVDIDRPGPSGVGLEDCQRVSQLLGEVLDDSERITFGYVLEVSSPGVDRPIRSVEDIRRNTGRRVLVDTAEPVEGGRRFRGVLLGGDEGHLRVDDERRGEVRLPLSLVVKARQDVDF